MRYVLLVVMMMVGFVGVVRADDAEDAKKGVEVFVGAWKAGDAKGMQEALVVPAGKEKELGAILEAVASVSRLQKEAEKRFGDSAAEYFADASKQFEARMEAVKKGPIKVMGGGESAVLTIPEDKATKTKGGTLVLVKKEGVWKIDGGTLFDITPTLVGMAEQLAKVADGVAKEIKDGKYTAAVDAYQEFNVRYAAAVKEAGGK